MIWELKLAITISAGNRGISAMGKDQVAALTASIRAGEYNLFLGAGVSLDASNEFGPLPSGATFKDDLCKATGSRPTSSLQRALSNLTNIQIKQYITDRFAKCTPGDTSIRIPQFVWRRIFTLNLDDVLEASYRRPGNLQNCKSFHFLDTFEELRTLDTVPIVHLHGWAERPEMGYVFSRSEYAKQMTDTNAWMTILADLMPVEPFIISGTNLDEIDLEFYLARRNSNTSREDRGPSFFVEPFPDSQTSLDCDRYGLILYQGTMLQFIEELDELVPARNAPYELIAGETRNLFPNGAPQSVVLSFSSDFDRVPFHAQPGGNAVKFSYGNPPDWTDLASNWDVGRSLGPRVRSIAEACLNNQIHERLIIIVDDTGVGKTTVLRRVGFDLSISGHVVLDCSALSRLDAQSTSEAIDLIDEPLIIIVDNFAEQSSAVANIILSISKTDVVFICAERSYRRWHIMRSIGDIPARIVDGLALNHAEASQLVQSYIKRGMTASPRAIKNPQLFSSTLVDQPIAVACCHILDDTRPLDSIVASTYAASTMEDRKRYLIATLAQFCFSGGVRYEILASKGGRNGWREQFNSAHQLPLAYFNGSRQNFIVPLNATLALRTLERAPLDDVVDAFESLALGIAPRVNREAIRKRMPEARLAGRLFDFEDVIRKFMPTEKAGEFYAKVQPIWHWNSRYWEQVSLYYLSKFRSEGDYILLQQAVQHARHAVAIELHPFTLTTMGKVLLAQLSDKGMSKSAVYKEALSALVQAIDLEFARGRASVHAYVTLFRGTAEYVGLGQTLNDAEYRTMIELIDKAKSNFPRDTELRGLADNLSEII
jgi:hypothetical protein